MLEHPDFDEAPAPSVLRRLHAWASTEAGGWTVIAGLILLLLAVALVGLSPRKPAVQAPQPTPGPTLAIQSDPAALAIAPDTIRDLSPAAARLWNAGLPFATAPNPPAKPFFAPSADFQTYGRALDCLTAAIYYEAGSEAAQGQAAVAQVVLNRVRHPAYPRTVCGVVFQGSERSTGCQFTFTCDGAMRRPPTPAGWARSRAVAMAALNGQVSAQVGTATHYHADWVAPFWASRLAKVVQVGSHIFYRWTGAWGLPQAFSAAYAGSEPEIAKMAGLSTPIPGAPLAETVSIERPVHIALTPTPGAPIQEPEPVDLVPELPAPDAVPAPVRPPAARREVAAAPDPLVNAGAVPPQRERSRIATPSGW